MAYAVQRPYFAAVLHTVIWNFTYIQMRHMNLKIIRLEMDFKPFWVSNFFRYISDYLRYKKNVLDENLIIRAYYSHLIYF